MARQDDFHVFLLMKRIENLQHDPAGKREDRLHPFPLQAFNEDFCTGEFHGTPPSIRKQRRSPIDRETLQQHPLAEARIIVHKCV